jgi:hypothetical protein
MSIAGYLCKQGRELRMPKTAVSLGITFEGVVLNGQESVEQRLRENATHSGIVFAGTLSGKPESLTPINGADPAERMHLRLPGKF